MTALARFTQRYALWVILVWILAAVGANYLVPQLEQVVAVQNLPFLPSNTPSSIAVQRSAAAFSVPPSDNVGYLVLERDGALGDADKAFYDQLIAVLRSDTRHVLEVVDWWGSELTSAAALSSDQHVATARVRLTGTLGTLPGNDSVRATRAVVAGLQAPAGLHIYVTGPGAALVDQNTAMDKQTVTIFVLAAAVALVLLLLVYRSLFTVAVPLVSVGLALAATRPVVALLASTHVIGVSRLAVLLGAVIVLGAGTGYTMVFLGRYHESRRRGRAPEEALTDVYSAAAPVTAGSALTLTAVLGCLSFSRISLFRDTGIACGIGVLVAAVAALTVTPALISLADSADLLKPPQQWMARRWRRVAVSVARWPSRYLIFSAVLMFVLAIPLRELQFEWDEGAAAPTKSESARGYQVSEQHFGRNHLTPDVITVESNQDLRSPGGLLEVEQITGAIMTIPGVTKVQSASRLNSEVPREATMTIPAGNLGDRLEATSVQLTSQPDTLIDIDTSLDDILGALDEVQAGLQQGAPGLTRVSAGARRIKVAVAKLRNAMGNFSQAFTGLPDAVNEIQGCDEIPACSTVKSVVRWADTLIDTTLKVTQGLGQVADGIASASAAIGGSAPVNFDFSGAVGGVQQARAATLNLKGLINYNGASIRDLPAYLHNLAAMFRGTPGRGLNAAMKALDDPAQSQVLAQFLSPNGFATRLFVYGDGPEWTGEGAQRTRAYSIGVKGATKEGAVKPTAIDFTGVGPAIQDLQTLEGRDVLLLGAITLFLVLLSAGIILRSPVAAFIILGVVVLTYMSALGASIAIWQYVFGHQLHWLVLPVSFVLLLTASAAYSLLFALRVREEIPYGIRIGMIRALSATGGVLSGAGIVFGAGMFALAYSSVVSVAQIGVTVGIGTLLNTFVVRRYVLPAVMVILGHWFWWPRPIIEIRWVPQRLVTDAEVPGHTG
ncbi:MAG: RND family transporter [Mycobacterium sp.]|uniref:MMPL/RND family transporter n=1 Tax=Mycobacterium sp. TaxID=1785 RepID=UPI001EB170EC|nr:RND family transporter [Mycobacterium sp.]MBW0016717.1 RND family transporter [Mycobacterium sp.]